MGATAKRSAGTPKPLRWLAHRARRPVRHPIVPGLVHERDLVLVIGEGGAGKSFFLAHLATGISGGLPVWGRSTRPAPIIFAALERADATGARLDAAARTFGEDDPSIAIYEGPLDLGQAASVDAFIAVAQATIADRPDLPGAGLIVIDTLAKATIGLDELSARDMGKALAQVDRIIAGTECAVVLIHHTARKGGNPRGSSAIEGAADRVLHLNARPSGIRTVELVKNNHGPTGDTIQFRIDDRGLVELGEDPARRTPTGDEKRPARPLPRDAGMALEQLKRLARTTPVVDREAWRAAVYAACGDRKPDAMRQVFRKAQQVLGEAGLIEADGTGVRLASSVREREQA